ncbi:MAG: ribose transport system permease protein [Solirubrobacteraceae bacterium]|nr:ribose transport system permease protein [Solirubrobacteraceae bacterium]
MKLLSPSRVSAIYTWIVIVIVFSVWIPNTFLTELTWKNIAASQAITAMVTLGLLFPLAAGVYDLAVGQTLGFAAVLSAYLVNHGFDTASAIAVTLAAGLCVGAINGALIVGVRINSFIATLGVSSVLLAVVGAMSNNVQITGLPASFQDMAGAQPLGIPIPVIYLAVLAVLAWYALEHSPLGRYLFAIGGAEEAARLAGVPTRRLVVVALLISSVTAAFAGIVLTGKLTAGDPAAGPGYLLPAYAAAFLGATQFTPGRFNVIGALTATYLLATGVAGLQLTGAKFWVTDLFNGLVLIIALALPTIQGRMRLRRSAERAAREASSVTVSSG